MILHIVRRSEWEDAVRRGRYAPESLSVEGFIHCSMPAQVIDTANRFYRGQKDLIVLCIDETRVAAELRYEAPVRPDRGGEQRNLTSNPFPRGKGNKNREKPFLSGKGNKKAEGERQEKESALFPHLYGELNVDAVLRIVELYCEEDGSFRLPDGLRAQFKGLR